MRKLFLVTFLLIFTIFSVAHAKLMPLIEDPENEWSDLTDPTQISSPLASTGLYGRLGTFGDIDAFSYTFDAPVENFPLSVHVPVCGEHFAPFYPSIAVVGAGFEIPETETLPFDLPEGLGAEVLVEAERITPRPFTQFDLEERVYSSTLFDVSIPQAGEYFVVVWEPDGHTGAYSLWTGNEEPDFTTMDNGELDAAMTLITSGEWMGQDCAAPLAVESCTATVSEDADVPEIAAPERWDVGDGYILLGEVRDATTCLPIANAEVTFWMANAAGEYDDAHTGRLLTNQQGAYRLESDRPGSDEGGEPRIRLQVTAPGYQSVVTSYLLDEADEGYLSIGLTAE